MENIFFYHLKEKGSEVYYFKEKHEVDFVCKSGLKITELFNVCYQLENKETISGEIASLIEGMKYFNLKEGTIIVAEGENKKIVESGFKINIIPFYQWALYY
ncbi:MAG: hypothetical protein M1409_08505 [Actinobacteria bacterium]|nr:hypothetical protein [Actinomycetota bacterium]